MIFKTCRSCGKLIPYPNSYCANCLKIVSCEKEKANKEYRYKSNKKYDQTRNPEHVRFYNSTSWLALKSKYLSDHHYQCEECIRIRNSNPTEKVKHKIYIAEEVHHKIPLDDEEGWNRRLDYSNLECLCHLHHNLRHNRFKQKRGNKTSINQK